VDKEIFKFEKKLKEFPILISKIDEKIKQSIEIVENAKIKLKDNQKTRDRLELDVEDYKGKINNKKSELNNIKTNKEYSAMLSEIEFLEKKKEEAEEKVIASLIETDEIQKEIKKAEEEREKIKTKYEKEKEEINKEKGKVEEELKLMQEKRKKIVSQVDEDYINLYMNLGKSKGGIPLSKVKNGFCSECYMKIRPQILVEIKKSDKIITCENCGRILYIEVEVKE
jgi:predicted  nucleic acid-binding Zn-ribbon protein